MRGHWRVVTANYRTGDELQILLMMLLQSIELHPRQITGCCVSSVVPQLNPALQQVARHAFKVEALPRADESVFRKHVNSAFIGTDLEAHLRAHGIETLVVVGLTTDHCVSTTVRMAAGSGVRICLRRPLTLLPARELRCHAARAGSRGPRAPR